MDETTTIARVRAGDREAYRYLVERYQVGLFNYLVVMVKDADCATDLAQEAFIKAYYAIDRYNPRFRFSTWLYRIASNLALSHLKKRPLESLEVIEELAGPDDLAASAATSERARKIRAAVGELPPKLRAVVSLYYWQDRSYQEIAETLEVPDGTVKTWLHRAKITLKEMIDEDI